MSIIANVLSTVNAPYGTTLSAHQLASCLIDDSLAAPFMGPVFSFYSEVSPQSQMQFAAEMGLDMAALSKMATVYSGKAGYKLPLAA